MMKNRKESIYKTELEEELIQACGERILPLGFSIVDLDLRLGGRSLVRMYIDKDANIEKLHTETASVSLEDCSQVSRVIEAYLEEKNLIPSRYDLEVSSPGLDRRLRLIKDFSLSVGSTIELKLVEKTKELGVNFKGILLAIKEDEGRPLLLLERDKKTWQISLSQVRQATRLWTTDYMD